MSFNRETMLRIEAVALIVADEKAEKIAEIAETMDGDIHGASIRYVLGCLKNAVRRGETKNMIQALERLEDSQVGDNGNTLAKPSALSREVARINRINNNEKTTVSVKRVHRVGMAKVYGSLQVQWDIATDNNTVERAFMLNNVDEQIKAYIGTYIGKLSKTSYKALKAIVQSSVPVKKIMTCKGYESLRNKAKYLHGKCSARDAITATQWASMLRQYVKVA